MSQPWLTDEQIAAMAIAENPHTEVEALARAVCDALRGCHRMLINTAPETRGVIHYTNGATAVREGGHLAEPTCPPDCPGDGYGYECGGTCRR